MNFDISKGGDFIQRSLKKHGDGPLPWKAEVISRVPEERLVVLYTFPRTDGPALRLIGKFYAGGVGDLAYRRMVSLHRALSLKGPTFRLAAPCPHFYDPELDLIVQQFVEGQAYYDLIEGDKASYYFQEAGKALADLHRLNLQGGPHHTLTAHLDDLIHPHPFLFAEAMPSYHPRVERLIHGMEDLERSWGETAETTPVHRDFHLRQLFHGEEKIWLIDWDLLAMGDPALDVGNFIVYLETHLAKGCEQAVTSFLEGYKTIAPASRLKRVSLYEGFTYLRLACKRFRLKEVYWQEKVSEMLRRSEASLMEGAGHATS